MIISGRISTRRRANRVATQPFAGRIVEEDYDVRRGRALGTCSASQLTFAPSTSDLKPLRTTASVGPPRRPEMAPPSATDPSIPTVGANLGSGFARRGAHKPSRRPLGSPRRGSVTPPSHGRSGCSIPPDPAAQARPRFRSMTSISAGGSSALLSARNAGLCRRCRSTSTRLGGSADVALRMVDELAGASHVPTSSEHVDPDPVNALAAPVARTSEHGGVPRAA
jgi:hypothetical protein